MMGQTGTPLIIDGRTVPFTHPDKVLFGSGGATKTMLADHYQRVWPRMAPLVADRPVTIKRYPRGLGGGGFYQRRAQDWFPEWVRTAALPMKDDPSRAVHEVVIDSPATLVFLVNIGALEIHASLARAEAPDMADEMIFDLDPPGDFTDEVRRAAVEFRDMLEELGLPVFVKTTGSRGFHVTIPLRPRFSFDATRALARALGERMIAKHPQQLTLNPRKNMRQGRILIDIWRNAYAQTAVAPYSTRARGQATVATPLGWDEMHQGVHPRHWTIFNIQERLDKPDPWADFFSRAIDLKAWSEKAPEDLRAALNEKGPA
jgi:bifunctional non-homologous end joining protein LigD